MSDCNDKTELDSAHAILHLGSALHYKYIWEFMLTLHISQNGVVHRACHEDCIQISDTDHLTGPHGDAGLSTFGQPAGAAAAGSSSEPQLTLKGGGGARRWGPAQFQAPLGAAPPRSASPGRDSTSSSELS